MKLQELTENINPNKDRPEYYMLGYPYKVGMQINDIDFGLVEVTEVKEKSVVIEIIEPKTTQIWDEQQGDYREAIIKPAGTMIERELATYNNSGEPYDMDIAEEVCKTCGGQGEVYWDHQDEHTGEHVPAKAPCPDCSLEEGDTKLEVDFDPANYKSVIKTLQDREISGKQKAVFLKSRIMRRLKAGGKVSRKEVIGMMDNLV